MKLFAACVTATMLAAASPASAQTPPPVAQTQTPPAKPPVNPDAKTGKADQTDKPAAPVSEYGFSSGAGMLIFYVKPDKTKDFDAVIAKIREALTKADTPIRKQQAASWAMYKSTEKSPDAAIYLFFFDPTVPSARYEPVKILSDAFPADAQALYDKLQGCVIKVERMGLEKMK